MVRPHGAASPYPTETGEAVLSIVVMLFAFAFVAPVMKHDGAFELFEVWLPKGLLNIGCGLCVDVPGENGVESGSAEI